MQLQFPAPDAFEGRSMGGEALLQLGAEAFWGAAVPQDAPLAGLHVFPGHPSRFPPRGQVPGLHGLALQQLLPRPGLGAPVQ